jgi:HSF-type DNA-binding
MSFASRVAPPPRSLDRVAAAALSSSSLRPRAANAAVLVIPNVSSDDDEEDDYDEDDPEYLENNKKDHFSRRRRRSLRRSTVVEHFAIPPPVDTSSNRGHSIPCHDGMALSFGCDDRPIARGGVACPFPWKLHDMLEYCCSTDHDSSTNHDCHDIVTWNDEGTAFGVMDTPRFVQTILPLYVLKRGKHWLHFVYVSCCVGSLSLILFVFSTSFFAQSKYASFQRQLNLYGFERTSGPRPTKGKKGGSGGSGASKSTKSTLSSTASTVSSSSHMSYYHHVHFVRGHRELVRHMVWCKIKGTMVHASSSHGPNPTTSSNTTVTKRRRATTPPRPLSRRRMSQPGLTTDRSLRHENPDQDTKYAVPTASHHRSPLSPPPTKRRRPCQRLQTLEPDVAYDDDHATTTTTLARPSTSLRARLPPRMVSMTMHSEKTENGLQDETATAATMTTPPPSDGDLVYFEDSPFYYLESTAASLLERDSAAAAETAPVPTATTRPTVIGGQGNSEAVHYGEAVPLWSDPRGATASRYPTTTTTAPWPLFPSLASSERPEYNRWGSLTTTTTTLSDGSRMGSACQLWPRHTMTTQWPWEQGATSVQWMC